MGSAVLQPTMVRLERLFPRLLRGSLPESAAAVLILHNSERNPPPSVSEGGKFFLSFDRELVERLKCGKSEWETCGGLAGDSRGTR